MSKSVPLQRLPEWLRRGKRRVARMGWAGMASTAVVLILGATAAWQLACGAPSPGPAGWRLPLVGVIWASAVAAASALPPAGFAVAGLWLAWHGLSLMAPWAGTPLVALPVLWCLIVALSQQAWQVPQRKARAFALGVVVCGGAGWALAGITGWNQMLGLAGDDRRWIGGVLLGGILAWGGSRLRRVMRGLAWTEPSFGRIWLGGLGVMVVGLVASAMRDGAAAEGWAQGAIEASAPWAGLTWFWCGGAFAVGLVRAATWATGWVGRGWTRGTVWWLLPAFWLGVTLLEWLTTHSGGPGLARTMPESMVPWVQEWPDRWRMALQAHAWVGVVVVVLGLGFLWQGRGSVRLLHRLNAVWLAALAGLVVVGDTIADSAGGVALQVESQWGPGVLLTTGLSVLVGGFRESGAKENSRRKWYPMGALVFFTGMVLAVEWQSAVPWGSRAGPAALLGMMHLALPQLCYEWWTGGRKLEGSLPLGTAAWLIFAGLGCVLPLLHRDPQNPAQLAYCPVLWLSLLFWLKWCQPGLNPGAGALAGAWLGSATVAAWSCPGLLLPEVPLVDWFNPPAAVLAGSERPFLDPLHFTLLFGLTAVGAFLGALTFRPKSGPGMPLMPLFVDPESAEFPPEGSVS